MRKIYGVPPLKPVLDTFTFDRALMVREMRQLMMNIVKRWPNVKQIEFDDLKYCCKRLKLQLVMDIPSHTIFFEELRK